MKASHQAEWKWMLRVHYDIGPSFDESRRIRNKEFTDFENKSLVYKLKNQILREGLYDTYASDNAQHDSAFCYEYWVAPSQILGFEVMEY